LTRLPWAERLYYSKRVDVTQLRFVSRVLRDRITARYLERVPIVPASHTKDSTLLDAIGLAWSSYFGPNDRVPFRKRRGDPDPPAGDMTSANHYTY
jgi:hypothetical protein